MAKRRKRQRDKLRASWSKRENDLMFHFPLGTSTKTDAGFLASVFTDEVTEELRRRGYDLTTLKFSIEPAKGNQKFASERGEEQSDVQG